MKPKDQILARMYVVLTLLSILPALVGLQVLRIHAYDGAELRKKGSKQASSAQVITAVRGAILDREGRTLAVNAARYNLALDPTVPGFAADRARFISSLSRVTGASRQSIARSIDRRKSLKYVMLRRGLREDVKEAIESWNVPGVILEPDYARRYNYGTTLSHVLGHVNSDGNGTAGLELKYNDILRGEDGRRVVKRDRRGNIKVSVDGSVVNPQDGESLVLTIDLIRQTIVEEELASGVEESGSNWGTAIAMDPNTGAVLAMANFPTYDPNRPGRYPTEARRNHAITDRIEPGSTFKLVSAVASLEQGVVSLDDSIDTGNGYRVFGRRELRDTHGHGRISFQEVIAVSSNIGIAEAVKELDGGDLYQYARNLGFGQPTWIDLPGEVSGSLKKPSAWSGTTKTSVSIGYEVDVTPIQLLTAYCALANGGLLVRPFLLQERRNYAGATVWQARQDSIRRAFKRKTARKLLPAFERVVNEGTAESAQIRGVRVAGKTGTAWKVHGGSYSRSKARASFVGFFPADNPRVALIVVLDEPETSIYGGATAAPIFQRIADRWISTFPDLARERSIALAEDAQSASTESSSADASLTSLPDVNGLPAAVAASKILAHGYAVDPPDTEDAVLNVVRQSPRPGRGVRRGAQIRLAVDHGSADEAALARMPNLEGLSARQATFWLTKLGVRTRVEGHGRVVSQSPQAGSDLQKNAVIRCK